MANVELCLQRLPAAACGGSDLNRAALHPRLAVARVDGDLCGIGRAARLEGNRRRGLVDLELDRSAARGGLAVDVKRAVPGVARDRVDPGPVDIDPGRRI